MQNGTKSYNYPGSQRVNVAVTWDEGYASYHGISHGRVDVFFSFRNTANNCREKSAEDIVPDLNRLLGEGLNLI
ncbi:hypothetical protein [uncultured Bacteroides sp.]|uniref:hypothetical protein n=1 Tax=uncultured Bacteroides sp. TaxID=162156 RepID=UPI002AAB6219|nr:hypothetical protein [uncultured Bacteroides sp.]